MLIHEQNHMLSEHMNQIRLRILTSGYAIMEHEDNWAGSIINPAFSRLYYILQGEFFMIGKDGKEKRLTEGNCYLLPAGYSFDYGCREFMEQVYFHVKLCDFDEIDMLRNCSEPLEFRFPRNQMTDYMTMVESRNILGSLKAQQVVYNTLFTLLDKYRIRLEKAEYSPQVHAAIEYIGEHLSMQLNVSEIAANSFTAVSTLTRKFKEETGLTVGQYIDESVMFQAEQLLISTKMSVLEISEKFGFCDQFYFARRFREKYLLPPREYRKMTII